MAPVTPVRRAGLYKRLFAAAMASSGDYHDKMVADRKKKLLGDLHGDVLEIGPGTGINLPYYAGDVHWLGIEPNSAMFPYVEKEAKQLGRDIQLRDGQAEQLDAPDSSMDAVVSTLVLCSVKDQQKVLQEVLRVLKPGGWFVFIEHVAAPRATGLRRIQSFVRPIWKLQADGCHPDRETWTAIAETGFAQVALEHFRLDIPIVGPHIAGFAIK